MAPQQGLFDTRSQEQILNDRWREQHAGFMTQNADIYARQNPGVQQAAQMGGLIAGGLGKKFMPPTLTPEEQVRTTAIQTATERSKAWRASHPDASIEDVGLETQRHLAEELIRAGDMQGIELAASVADQMQARARAQAELLKLDDEHKVDMASLRQMNWDFENDVALAGKNRMVNAWEAGGVYGDNPIVGMIDEDLNLNVKEADGTIRVIPGSQYFTHPPVRGFKDWTIGDLGIPDAEAREFRDTARAVMNEANSAVDLADILVDAAKDGEINFLGANGALTATATKWSDNLLAFARSVDPDGALTVDGYDVSTDAAREKYLKENPEVMKRLAEIVPEKFRTNSVLQQRWIAGMTRMGYAAARAAEPGARNVTDNDFLNAVNTIAGYTTNPEAFRQVMLTGVEGHIRAFEDRRSQFDIPVQRKMIAGPGYDRYNQAVANFRSRFGGTGDYGTGANPGPGLQISPEQGEALILDVLGN